MTNQIDIKGFCSDQFTPLQDAFEKNFTEGDDIGASLCLTLESETIVDLWAGYTDLAETQPWEEDTIACVYSSTKIPAIICTLMVIDRGLMALDEPVACYWPEFAQQGKEKITVRQALTHRALVPGLKSQLPTLAVADWDRVVAKIAAEPPWFDRDTICYHALTYGFILGELVQRVSGKPFRQFFNEELADPLAADFQMGLVDKSELLRFAPLLNVQAMPFGNGSLEEQLFTSFTEPIEHDVWHNDWEIQSAVSPSGSGYTNARGLCKFATMMANNGDFEGKSYLSPDIIREASSEQYHGIDPMLGDIRLGLGFGLDGTDFPAPTPNSFHWGGYGGSWCFMDPVDRLAGAYVMNNCFVMAETGEFDDPRMDRFFSTIRSLFE